MKGEPRSPAVAVGICTLLLILGYLVVRRAYPRPLAGIPYNRDAARRLTGDLAEVVEFGTRGGSFRLWFLEQATRHNSAITQVFLGPFVKPAVVVSDYREVHDILSHRDGVDFKRGKKVDAFRGILPHAFPAMETFDPLFKPSRDLARDLMTPSILHSVNAPRIHDVTMSLLELWTLKLRLAGGKPFDVSEDVSEFSFDAILSAATGLGPDGGDVKRQLQHLTAHQDQIAASSSHGGAAVIVFPRAAKSAKLAALRVDEDSLWKGFVMPWPRLYHFLNNLRPSVRAARHTLQSHIATQITSTLVQGQETPPPSCALDYVMQRELRAAAAASRPPRLTDPRILEPIYGYLIAGHDTSSGALTWFLRRLTAAHPQLQAQIRTCLRAAYPDAWRERRAPTAAELVRRPGSPWLDAALEETLRLDSPVVNIMVVTRTDTLVLGCFVPRDTPVFLNLAGPSLNRQSVFVEEGLRREGSGGGGGPRGNWDGEGPEEFRPERWLRRDAAGRMLFDAGAGPALAFSAGNRGCWGKRLGYLELRIVAALLLWFFEFEEVPEELVSWETYDSLVTAPKECLVHLREVGM
ncbi:cytochrome P450 [Chaetomidium leptoderma]|uniref:Cytochrome P450 n=1 Tax=Chaetomidium leptoderma TaxID=669021 RepID=A0AAN6VNB5_9PEZI|nr:cytochrome P450 [Chaetomidium leptoderma]